MLEKIERVITSLETAPMSIAGWLAGFVGIVWIRIFLEAFSNPDVSRGFLDSALPTLLHCTLFYLGAVVVAVVVVSVVTRTSPLLMMRSIIFILPIMWLAPLIDLTYGGARIAYIFAAPSVLLNDFFTYFGPLTGEGATLGLRIELGLIIVLLGVYVFIRTKRLSTAFLGMIAGYVVIFAAMVLPSILVPSSGGTLWGGNGVLQNSLIAHNSLYPLYAVYHATNYASFSLFFDVSQAQAWYVILCISGMVWFYRVRKNATRALFRNIRPERLTHFFVAGLLGGLIAIAEGVKINWTILDFITIATALFTITFAWMFAVVLNDLVDEPIDAISNTDRPLITGALTKEMMKNAALVCGLLTLVGALALGSYATFWVLLFSAAYYMYSVPPLRLKRVPLLSSALIGVATLAIMLLGFFLISTSQALSAFPASVALLVVLFMTLITNVRDLKDSKGDAAAGIWTLPTILGDARARMVIGVMMFVAYAIVPLLMPITRLLWIPSLIAGVVSWLWVVQGRGERPVFSLYFIYLVSIVLLLRFF